MVLGFEFQKRFALQTSKLTFSRGMGGGMGREPTFLNLIFLVVFYMTFLLVSYTESNGFLHVGKLNVI